MRWFEGSTVAVNVSMPSEDADCGEMREQDGRDPVAVPGIRDGEGDLRPVGRPGDVGAMADDRALGASEREQRQAFPGSAALRAAQSRFTPPLK